MESKTTVRVEKHVLRRSAFWYTGTSLGVALLFLTLNQLVGGYPRAAIAGGVVWSFILSMIVTMPLYSSYFKRRKMGEHGV